MGKTAIVIGATGLVGKAVIEELIAAQEVSQINAITRRSVPFDSPKVQNIIVDFDHLEKYAEAFRGDYLFSCLGTTKARAGSIEAQRKVDLDYQFEAAQLAAENGVKHYLLVSSSMADANSKNEYLKMKGELERNILQLPFQRISIFQPSLLLGSRDHFRFGERVAGGLSKLLMPVIQLAPGLRKYRPIEGQEVAKKMVQVTQQPGPTHERFTLDQVFPL